MKRFYLILLAVVGYSLHAQQAPLAPQVKRICATDKVMTDFFAKNPQAKLQEADLRNFLINNDYKTQKKRQ